MALSPTPGSPFQPHTFSARPLRARPRPRITAHPAFWTRFAQMVSAPGPFPFAPSLGWISVLLTAHVAGRLLSVVITACIRVLQIVSGGDGMVEDIITALSRFKGLFVIARNSSFTYKGRAVDVKQVDRELGTYPTPRR